MSNAAALQKFCFFFFVFVDETAWIMEIASRNKKI